MLETLEASGTFVRLEDLAVCVRALTNRSITREQFAARLDELQFDSPLYAHPAGEATLCPVCATDETDPAHRVFRAHVQTVVEELLGQHLVAEHGHRR